MNLISFRNFLTTVSFNYFLGIVSKSWPASLREDRDSYTTLRKTWT